MPSQSARSPRRSTAEVRAALIDAAAEQFAAHGYAETSMRAIADRAQVSLSVLYRQFENKEQLFSAALLAPLTQAFDQFALAWRRQLTDRWEDEEMIREFVQDLLDNLAPRRQALLQLVSLENASSPRLGAELRQSLTEAFEALTRMSEEEGAARGWREPGLGRHRVWLAITLVFGHILVSPISPTTTETPSARQVDLLVSLLMHGLTLTGEPDPSRQPDPHAERRL